MHVLAAAAMLVALAFILLALFQRGQTATPDSVLVVGIHAEPRSLDPHTTTALNDFRILVNVYEGLVRFAPGSLDIAPALAERWTVSPDGLTYTFELREDVRFHDGSQFDAEAVRFSFERMLNDTHPFHDTGPFPLAFFFDAIDTIDTPDDRTVILRLDEPFAPLLSNLAYPTGFIVSPQAVREHGRDFGRRPSGTGPFRFAGWEPDRHVTLVANDDFRDGRPPMDSVVYRPITDEMTRFAEMRAGGFDVVVEMAPDNVAWFRGRAGFSVLEEVGPHLWFLILNTRKPPFDDVRVRQAANLAIRRDSLASHVLQGTAVPAAGAVAEAFGWARTDDLHPYPYDPEQARALLAQAGHDGVTVRLDVPQGGSGMLAPVQMAEAMQADFARAGFDVRIRTWEWNSYLDRVNSGLGDDVDMAAMAWMTNDPDTLPSLALHSAALPPQGFNSGYFEDPTVDDLIERARTATDTDVRGDLYAQLSHRVQQLAPWVVTVSWKQNIVLADSVQGVALEPSFFLLLDSATKTAR